MACGDRRALPSLGDFIHCVSEMRKAWGLPKHKELWFRGESKDFGDTILCPELYRPARGDDGKSIPLKPIGKLLAIEDDLHDEFMRNAVEHEKESTEDWDWDSYFLMQHHEGPTRLVVLEGTFSSVVGYAIGERCNTNGDVRRSRSIRICVGKDLRLVGLAATLGGQFSNLGYGSVYPKDAFGL